MLTKVRRKVVAASLIIGAGATLAPMGTAAVAAELAGGTANFSISLDDSANQDPKNELISSEAVYAHVGFSIPESAEAGDTYTLTLSNGYNFAFAAGKVMKLETLNGDVLATATLKDNDTIVVTITDKGASATNASGALNLPVRMGTESTDTIEYNKAYPLTLTSADGTVLDPHTSYIFKKPQISQYNGALMYAESNNGVPEVRPVATVGSGTTSATITMKPASNNWEFTEGITASDILAFMDNDTTTTENPATPGSTATTWEQKFTGTVEVVSSTPEELVLKVTNIPAGYGVWLGVPAKDTNAAISTDPYIVSNTFQTTGTGNDGVTREAQATLPGIVAPTTAPTTDAPKPVETTVAPTSAAPATTVAAPSPTTDAPKPVETTAAPAPTNAVPTTVAPAPTTDAPKPVETTAVAPAPTTGTATPTTAAPKPVETTVAPAPTDAPTPVETTAAPAPTSSTPKPVETSAVAPAEDTKPTLSIPTLPVIAQPSSTPVAPTAPVAPSNAPTAPSVATTASTAPTAAPAAPAAPVAPTAPTVVPVAPTTPTVVPVAPTAPVTPSNAPTAPSAAHSVPPADIDGLSKELPATGTARASHVPVVTNLPRTGANVGILAMIAVVFVGVGFWMTRRTK